MGREPHPNRQSPNKAAVHQQTEAPPNRAPHQAKKSFAAKTIASCYPTSSHMQRFATSSLNSAHTKDRVQQISNCLCNQREHQAAYSDNKQNFSNSKPSCSYKEHSRETCI